MSSRSSCIYTAHRSLIYIWPHTHTHTHRPVMLECKSSLSACRFTPMQTHKSGRLEPDLHFCTLQLWTDLWSVQVEDAVTHLRWPFFAAVQWCEVLAVRVAPKKNNLNSNKAAWKTCLIVRLGGEAVCYTWRFVYMPRRAIDWGRPWLARWCFSCAKLKWSGNHTHCALW